jgi:hypothetical protein
MKRTESNITLSAQPYNANYASPSSTTPLTTSANAAPCLIRMVITITASDAKSTTNPSQATACEMKSSKYSNGSSHLSA